MAKQDKAAASEQKQTEDSTTVLMLSDHPHEGKWLKCGSVVALPAPIATALVREGKADDNEAAVKAYSKAAAPTVEE